MIVTSILMAVTFSSCGLFMLLGSLFDGAYTPELSFEYELTEEDLTEFNGYAKDFEKFGMEGVNTFAINTSMANMMDKLEYIQAQYFAAYIGYCLDQSSAEAIANLTEAETILSFARTQYLDTLKKLAQGSKIKDALFEGWSESDLAMLLMDNEKISALQLENSQITRDFYALEENDAWSANVNDLYVDFVENNQLIAQEYGYDNYYEYSAKEEYGRAYTAEQREAFRGYVAEYILPLYVDACAAKTSAHSALNTLQQGEYTALFSNRQYVYDYIDSYEGSLNSKMNAMFERKNATIFADGENALQGAFVNYVSYYGQPFAYFGPGYQDNFTIVHEMGHYTSLYHFDMGGLPYDLAETHSQGNEWMFMSYLEGKLNKNVFNVICADRLVSGLGGIILSTVVDHFEELVYTAETPVKANEYEALMMTVCAQYPNIEKILEENGVYSPFEYAQLVTIPSPVYYLNYATSELASMSLYSIAKTSGYKTAQTAFTKIQEGVDPNADFLTAVNAAGILNPFSESTYTKLTSTFFAK